MTVPAPEMLPVQANSVRSGLALLVASGATFLAFLDVTVVNVAFPALLRGNSRMRHSRT